MYKEKINYFAGTIIPKSAVDGFEDTLRDLITFDGVERKLQRIANRESDSRARAGLKKPVTIAGEVVVDLRGVNKPNFFFTAKYEFEADELDYNVILRISAERSAIFNDIYREGLIRMRDLTDLKPHYKPEDADRLEMLEQTIATFLHDLSSILPH